MTTKNPYTGGKARQAWNRGYQAGTNDYDSLKLTRIRDLERQVANLVEKNDNQREIIVQAGEQHDIDVIQLEQMGNGYKTGYQAGLKAGQEISDSVITAKEERAYGNGQAQGFIEGRSVGRDEGGTFAEGIAEGERRLEGLGSVGFDAGFIKGKEVGRDEGGTFDEGNEAGYADGWVAARKQSIINSEDAYNRGMTDGRNMGLADWMRHFILYMQENEQPFAVCSISQLEDLQEASGKLRQIVDAGEDTGALLEDIENILTSLEDVTR